MKRTADSLLKKNEEYVKLRSEQRTSKAPREQPKQQSPGADTHRKPDYRRWTIDELRRHAAELGDAHADRRSREALIEYIVEHRAY